MTLTLVQEVDGNSTAEVNTQQDGIGLAQVGGWKRESEKKGAVAGSWLLQDKVVIAFLLKHVEGRYKERRAGGTQCAAAVKKKNTLNIRFMLLQYQL